jgi:hypothetical protein
MNQTVFVLWLQKEREDYEVVIEDGEFMYKNSRQILDTSGGPREAKWIFVLSTSRNLYVGQVMFRPHLVKHSNTALSLSALNHHLTLFSVFCRRRRAHSSTPASSLEARHLLQDD